MIRLYIFLSFATFLIFQVPHLHAQQLFTPVSNAIALSTAQEQKLEKLQNDPLIESIQLIRVGDILSIQNGTTLRFRLPGGTDRVKAEVTHVTPYANGDLSWYGKVKTYATSSGIIDEEGDLTFVKKDGGFFGHFSVGEDVYEVVNLGEDLNAFTKVNMGPFDEFECSFEASSNGNNIISDIAKSKLIKEKSGNGCEVRLLILYTDAAEDAASDIGETAQLIFNQIQQSLMNSDITNDDLILKLVGTENISWTEGNFANSTYFDLLDIMDDDEVLFLKNQRYADLVLVLTDVKYFDAYGNRVRGSTLVNPNINAPDSEYAFSIADYKASTKFLTGAHEVFHQFHADHQKAGEVIPDDNTYLLGHGHVFTIPGFFDKTRYTIMAVKEKPKPTKKRVLHFSNPDIDYDDIPTGVENINDNAAHIRGISCLISAHTEEPPPFEIPFSVLITGPIFVDAGTSVNLGTFVQGGTSPFTYEWQTSWDGINYGSVIGTNSTQMVTASNIGEEILFVKVTVTDDDNEVIEAFHPIKSLDDDGPQFGSSGTENASFQLTATISGQPIVHPNPFSSEFNVSFLLNIESELRLTLFDAMGKEVDWIYFENHPAGQFNYKFHPTGLSSGIYFLKYETSDISKSIPIIFSEAK